MQQSQWNTSDQARCLQALAYCGMMNAASGSDISPDQTISANELRWPKSEIRRVMVAQPVAHLAAMDSLIAAGYTVLYSDEVSIWYTE